MARRDGFYSADHGKALSCPSQLRNLLESYTLPLSLCDENAN